MIKMKRNDKKVLITGVGGFVGSHLSETLLKPGVLKFGMGVQKWISFMLKILWKVQKESV